jgi:hypothetical protein
MWYGQGNGKRGEEGRGRRLGLSEDLEKFHLSGIFARKLTKVC